MLAKIYSAAVYGVDAYEVEIEVNVGPGKPVMVIVGSAGRGGEGKQGPRQDRHREQRLPVVAQADHSQSRAGRH